MVQPTGWVPKPWVRVVDLTMLGYVLHVQREDIRNAIACVKHQIMSGSNIGDDHKEYFAGDSEDHIH